MPNGDPNQGGTGGPSAGQVVGSLFTGDIIGGLKKIFSPRGGGFSGTESISGFELGPADPLAIPRMDRVSAQEQHAVEIRISQARIRGEEPSAADLAELQSIKDFRTSQERLFQQLQQQFPARFAAFKIPFGTLIQDVFRLLGVPQPGDPGGATGGVFSTLPPQVGGGGGAGDPGAFPTRRPTPSAGAPTAGQPNIGGFNPATFIKCLIQSLLPIQTGGRMPFVTTGSFASNQGGFDFGGFLGGALDIAKRFLGPTTGPGTAFPQATQTSLLPFIRPGIQAATRALAPVFAGAAGGAIGQGFFDFGGAATLDESAAFTDPIPGSCRPKAHTKTNPCTGKGVWFVPRGQPLVFSGDLSAARRLDRVAKTLDKARPKRRHHHHPKRRPR